MIIKTKEYSVEILEGHGKAIFTGTMRLDSPRAYEAVFQAIIKEIDETTDVYELEVKELSFLNSSGLTAMARVFIHAREENKPLRIIGSIDIPWQKKSLSSLQKLWSRIELKIN